MSIHIKNEKIIQLVDYLEKFLHNKTEPIILSLIAFFSEGHLLIEDLPGVGKTTLSLSIAKAMSLSFARIQCTSDLLPSDITGITIYSKKDEKFIFKKGPIFTNILLVDEINRATQKTQSAFLEIMEERQVTVDGKTYELPEPFFVIATQNPVEHYGTYKLPDSQMDRFIMNISIGYPSQKSEVEILKTGSLREKISKMQPIFHKNEIHKIINKIHSIYASEKVLNYIVNISNATRANTYILNGISPRGSLSLLNCAKTLAFFQNRDFVIPEDIKTLAPYVYSHRIICKEEFSSINKRDIIYEILDNVPLPI